MLFCFVFVCLLLFSVARSKAVVPILFDFCMVLSFLVLLAPLFVSFALPSIVITSLWKKGAGRLADRLLVCPYYEPPHHNTNKMTVRQPKTQLRCVAKDLSFLHADNENSGQTGRLSRLI